MGQRSNTTHHLSSTHSESPDSGDRSNKQIDPSLSKDPFSKDPLSKEHMKVKREKSNRPTSVRDRADMNRLMREATPDPQIEQVKSSDPHRNSPIVHVRVLDQFGENEKMGASTGPLRHAQVYVEEFVHRLCPYPGKSYCHLQALIDWDHRIPSLNLIVRILACYDEISKLTLAKAIKDIELNIQSGNLFPEFDVPNYAPLVADEIYSSVLDANGENELELQFTSDWRHQVDHKLGRKVVHAITQLDIYANAMAKRKREDLGDPIIVGWMAPAIAHSLHWAVEVWLVTDFIGYRGKALVFFVDSKTLSVTRFCETEIQAS